MRFSMLLAAAIAWAPVYAAAQDTRLAKDASDGEGHGLVCIARVQCVDTCATGTCVDRYCRFYGDLGPEITCCTPGEACTIPPLSPDGPSQVGNCQPVYSDNGSTLGICLPDVLGDSELALRAYASLLCAFGADSVGDEPVFDVSPDSGRALNYMCFGYETPPEGTDVAALLLSQGDCDGDGITNFHDAEPCVAEGDDDDSGDDDDDDVMLDAGRDAAGDDDDSGDDDDNGDDDDGGFVDAGELPPPVIAPVGEVVGDIRGGGLCATSAPGGAARAMPMLAVGLAVALRVVRRRRKK